MIQPLNSNTGQEVDIVTDTQVIRPLEIQQEEVVPEKSVTIPELIEQSYNNVIAFIINWIKSSYTRSIYNYLNNEYKQEIIKDIVNEIKK